MTKFLKNKFAQVFGIFGLVIFGVFFVFSTTTNVAGSIDYPKHIFKEIGISLDVLSDSKNLAVPFELELQPTQNKINSKYVLPKQSNSVLLLYTSQLAKTEPKLDIFSVSNYKMIIVICDFAYQLFPEVSCDYSKLSATAQFSANILSINSANIFSYEKSGVRYVIFPENLLVDPKLSPDLLSYFKAIKRTLNVLSGQSNGPVISGDEVTPIISKSLLEALSYMVPMLFFISIFGFTLRKILLNPSDLLTLSFYKDKLAKLSKGYYILRPYFAFTFLMASLFYFPAVILLSVLDKGAVVLSSASNYFIQSLNINNVIGYLTTGNSTRTLFSAFSYLLFISFVYLIIPGLLKVLVIAFKKVFSLRLNNANIKYIFFILISLFLAVLVIDSKLSFALATLSTILLLIIYAFFLTWKQNINLLELFKKGISRKEQITVISIFSLLLIVWVLRLTFLQTITKTKTYEKLIGVIDEVVMLPYAKSFQTDGFDEFLVDFDFPVFANNVLLYDPNFKVIENKPIEEFNAVSSVKDNFMLVAYAEPTKSEKTKSSDSAKSKDTKYVKALLTNPELLPFLNVETPSKYFVVAQTFNPSFDAKYEIEIKFDCTYDQKSSVLKMNVYSNPEQSAEKITVMNFPGCSKEDRSSFRVNVTQGDIFKEGKIFEFIDFDKVVIKEMLIYENDVLMKTQFLADPALSPVLYSAKNSDEKKVKVYSVGLNESFVFDVDKNISDPSLRLSGITPSFEIAKEGSSAVANQVAKRAQVNISSYLNTLISEGTLKNSFVLWSTKPNALIRSDFDD